MAPFLRHFPSLPSTFPTPAPSPAVLPWRTRLYFWLAVTAISLVGLYAGDYLVPETEEEKAVGSLEAAEKELIVGGGERKEV
jgi:hypothetical protein